MKSVGKCKYKKFQDICGWLYLLPFIILISMFYVYPVIHNIWLSLTNYSGLNLRNYEFVGLQNYQEILSEGLPGFAGMLAWTLVFAGSVVVGSFLIGTVIAVLLENAAVTPAKIYRGIFILPWVVPAIITLLMWRGLLNDNQGLINNVLAFLGFRRVPWLTTPFMAKLSCILVITWFSFPYFIVVAQGILKSIPHSYYEAAYIDGSKAFQSFVHITLPLVVRAIFPILIMAFIMQFNQFGIYILTAGEPAADRLGDPGATDLLLTYVFNTAFRTFRYNLAAAYSVIMFVLVAILAIAGMKLGRRIGSTAD